MSGRIAAPGYVREQLLRDVPPGHRFGLYLPLWNARWEIDDGAKREALGKCRGLGDGAELLAALRARQRAQAEALPDAGRLLIDAESSAPFATGLGHEHPVENGFAFLTPYGLPYLAGSGVKGVLRRAAAALSETAEAGWDRDRALLNALFGPEDPAASGSGAPLGEGQRRRGALSFWDVFPEPHQSSGLVVEVMTPHQGSYYQGMETPHDAGQPKPINFLALPARSKFRFVVTCEPALLPEPLRDIDWRTALSHAFAYAFDWLGFGAKTAVGYGAMAEPAGAGEKRKREAAAREAEKQAQKAEQERQAQLASATPAERAVSDCLSQRADKSQPELNALIGALGKGHFGALSAATAELVKQRMKAANRWKEESTKKNPDKDHDYQDTLKVKRHLGRQ